MSCRSSCRYVVGRGKKVCSSIGKHSIEEEKILGKARPVGGMIALAYGGTASRKQANCNGCRAEDGKKRPREGRSSR